MIGGPVGYPFLVGFFGTIGVAIAVVTIIGVVSLIGIALNKL
jgi:hypothetical protein